MGDRMTDPGTSTTLRVRIYPAMLLGLLNHV